MSKKLIGVLAGAAMLVLPTANAALINVALDGTATASNTWLGASGPWTPDKAIDGDASTVWNSGRFARQWIEVDLGRALEISRITGLVEQTPAGAVRHEVSLDGVLAFIWAGDSETGQLFSEDFAAPVVAQTVRIHTISSPSWVAWREIGIFSNTGTNAVPNPASLALMVAGLGVIWLRRRA